MINSRAFRTEILFSCLRLWIDLCLYNHYLKEIREMVENIGDFVCIISLVVHLESWNAYANQSKHFSRKCTQPHVA
jgi:hypothetical protein